MQFSAEFSGKIRPRRDPQVGKGDGCPEEDDACQVAALAGLVAVRRGHLENLKWVRANRDGTVAISGRGDMLLNAYLCDE